ncbi:MAG TPA: bacteriohopanetetrol glucosamine biosynthesis glycosyltransferase HpnI [Steroidobacteraceae bacterium]|nr:bacteriohopanetetrol glucosamine biosynthesis glycosyltransferase HpnI [Steroidobacteraceae bacterium]
MLSSAAHLWLTGCGMAVTATAMAYTIIATVAAVVWTRRWRNASATTLTSTAGAVLDARAVTVLKPLCGAEPDLYLALRSFCEQDYPGFQIVFGIRDASDPAAHVVRRLQREFPKLALELVVDARTHGRSLKVSNLINMMGAAAHECIVLADSDVRVPRDYLARVVAPLADPSVGIVTCPYRAVARGGAWSVLLAAFVNDWFMPSVLVAASFGSRAFAFGATIAMRREVLRAIGGFKTIADQLADDYRLGELTRRNGLRTVLSDVVVETYVDEPSAPALVRHELRWLRTIRTVRPAGYLFSLPSFGWPVAALGCLLAAGAHAALLMLAITGGARVLLHFAVRSTGSALFQLWVLPLNDLLAFLLWAWGFVSRRVHWRAARYRVARDGSVQPLA